MKKILFPFEIDRKAYKEAYVYAISMARNLRAELIVLNAFYVEANNSITRDQYHLLLRNHWLRAYKEVISFHNYYLSSFAKAEADLRLKTDHRFIHGNLIDEFSLIMHKEQIDLVVLPSFEESEPSRRRIRTMRREALEMPMTSLLIAPHEMFFKPVRNVLFAYDMKEQDALIDRLDEVHHTCPGISNIQFVQFSKHGMSGKDPEQEPLKTIVNTFQRGKQIQYPVLQGLCQRNEISGYITDHDIHLLVLSTGQWHILSNLFRWPNPAEAPALFKIPLLILREKVDQSKRFT